MVSRHASELDRALSRPDSATLIRQIDAYAAYDANDDNWNEDAAAVLEVVYDDDADRALAFAALAIARFEDAELINKIGCGLIQDVLREPSAEVIARVVAEANRCLRFRWALSSPFKAAVSEAAWSAIEPFRITGPHEEPALETFPFRH